MARVRGRMKRGHPPVMEPMFSLRFMTVLVVGFCVIIMICVGASYTSQKYPQQQNQKDSLNKSVFSNPDDIPVSILTKLDAILVLGGGAPDAWNLPPIYVRQRCNDAAKVVKRFQSERRSKSFQSLSILCQSAGTAHVPQLLNPQTGLPIWESTVSAAYLLQEHKFIKSKDVYVETTSYDTIGNAFYARTGHTGMAGWSNLLVITNEFHMARSKAIYEWIFGLPNGTGKKGSYRLYFLESDNVGLSEEALKVRRDKESSSLSTVVEYARQYKSMHSVWNFLTTRHGLYTASDLVERSKSGGSDASEELKRPYGGT